jgi:hypothetical protein
MTGIILCEGLTDQILLSQYFCGRFHFCFDKKRSKKSIIFDSVEESFIYSRGSNDFLYISRTGGKDNLPRALSGIWNKIKLDAGLSFDYVAIITDHDSEEEVVSLKAKLKKATEYYGTIQNLSDSNWQTVEIDTGFQQTKKSEFLTLFIPLDHPGALETFLLDSLNEIEENQHIVDKSRNFVNSLVQDYDNKAAKFPPNVLSSRRMRVKAPLSVFFGVTNPEGGFRTFEEYLKEIDWSAYENIQQGFKAFDSVLRIRR